MAPVGRWQQNRDLSWYAKGDKDAAGSAEEAAAKLRSEREEEIKRIKEAEQEAMARALGLPVASRSSNNANMTPLGGKEVERAIQESSAADEGAQDGGGSRGVGFGSFRGTGGTKAGDQGDRMEGTGYEMVPEKGLERRGTRDGRGTRGGRGENGDRRRGDMNSDEDRAAGRDRRSKRYERVDERQIRRRRHSPSADRDYGVRCRDRSRSTGRRRHRSRSSDMDAYKRHRPLSRSRSQNRWRGRGAREKRARERSSSPAQRRSHHDRRSRRNEDYDRGR